MRSLTVTDLLREREAEVQALRQEKAELENQLMLRGNPINLDQAYADLLIHLKKREAEFRSTVSEQAERQHSLEREIRKLKDKVHVSRKVIEDQEKNISLLDTEASQKLLAMQHQLEALMKENEEKSQDIVKLENVVHCLTVEADQNHKETHSDRELIDHLSGLVDKCGCEQNDLERLNVDMQNRVDTLRSLLDDREEELRSLERLRDQREGELLDELDRVRSQLDETLGNQRKVLNNKEEEIHLLKLQLCKYEDIIDEAEYTTHEQRCALMENKREIEKLSSAVERVENSGLLGQLDKMWCGYSDVGYTRTSVPPGRERG